MNFQGAGGSDWLSLKHYWDKDRDQIIPRHCTKARKTNTFMQISADNVLWTLPCFLSGSLGAAFFSHCCTV